MLEYWFENATHHVLHEDLDIGNVSAWQASIVRGHHKVVENGGQQSLELYPYVRYLLPYFKSVRAGAVRVGAASTVPREFAPLGFINLDGSRVIIVKAATGGTVQINGLPAGKYSTRFVSEGDDGNLGNLMVAAGGSTQVDIPDAGVLAIRGL